MIRVMRESYGEREVCGLYVATKSRLRMEQVVFCWCMVKPRIKG